jgi:hypothetical protein
LKKEDGVALIVKASLNAMITTKKIAVLVATDRHRKDFALIIVADIWQTKIDLKSCSSRSVAVARIAVALHLLSRAAQW